MNAADVIVSLHKDYSTDTSHIDFPTIEAKRDPNRKMLALTYHGTKDLKVEEIHVPMVTDPGDAIIKVTATTICGSDLHLYHGEFPGLKKGDVLGHEAMGIVEDVGPDVRDIKKGDRVVISAVIACGSCEYCKRGEWSCCDTTNPSKGMEKLYGHRTAALFGCSHVMGGYSGCQAEYVRVPIADVNCFKLPDTIRDEQALMLADIACTGWHGTELAEVKEGDVVVVFGCGPVGLQAMMWSKFRGAKRVVAIDVDENRLAFAKEKLSVEIVNAKEEDSVKAIQKLIPGGPNKVIDCVGFRFPDTLLHKVERALKLETDSPNILNAAFTMVRKTGTIAIIGDYLGYTNHFNIGAMMEKSLTIRGGQLWAQKYIPVLMKFIISGEVDPSFVITHTLPFSKCAEAYSTFDKHEDGMIKVFLRPDSMLSSK